MSQPSDDPPSEETFADVMNEVARESTSAGIITMLGIAAVVLAVMAFLTPWLHILRYVSTIAELAFLAASLAALTLLCRKQIAPANTDKATLTAVGTLALAVFAWIISPQPASAHPLFKTPLSAKAGSRPAIQVDILDDSEFFGRAELYLTVESSRFPSRVKLLFPLNRGDFQGCTSRFIQLPFEVVDDDVLLLNLIDNDDLSESQEQLVLNASKATGFCLAIAGTIYQPDLESLIQPMFMSVADVIGNSVVLYYRDDAFQPMGSCEYIIQSSRPDAPNRANRVSVLDKLHARVQVRLYYPPSELLTIK